MTSKALANQRLSPTSLRVLMGEIENVHVGTTLHITDGTSERIFYFVKGGVRFLSSGPLRVPGFEEHVFRSTKVDKDVLARAIAECRERKQEPRAVLIEKGILPRDDVNAIISRMVRDALFELVFWRNAFFTMHTQPPPEEIHDPDRGGIGGSIDNAELSKTAIRWLDDWSTLRQVLNSDQTQVSVTPTGSDEKSSLAPSIGGLLDACATGTSVRDLWLTTGRPLDELCRTLVELTEKKLITLTADRSWSRRSPTEEIQELEESLHHLVAKDPIRERLVILYRRTKQPAQAVNQLKILARNALATKNLAAANDHYKLILNLEPDNIEIFETLIELNGTSKITKEVKNFALNHLQRLANNSLYQEADHCARLLETLPGVGTDVVEFKASMLASRGKTREAAVECMRVAKFYDDRGDIALASHLYRKAAAYQNRAASPDQVVKIKKRNSAAEGSRRATAGKRGRRAPSEASGRGVRLLVASLLLAAVGAGFYWRGELGNLARDGGDALVTSLSTSPPTANASGRGSGDGASSRQTEEQPNPAAETCGDGQVFRTRALNESQQATYANSCKLSIRDRNGEIVRELAGAAGARWAIGHDGRFICRWKPGGRPVVFGPAERKGLALSWAIPDVVDALVVGRNRVVIRAGRLTVVYNSGGTQIFEAELPEWEEGVILGGHLVLTRAQPRALWVVEAESLNLLWTCRNEPEGMVVW